MGEAEYKAFDLSSQICDAYVNGDGFAEVFVSDSLLADLQGTSVLCYKGFPAIEAVFSGGGLLVNKN